MSLATILKSCDGVRYTSEEKSSNFGRTWTEEKFYKTGDVKVPEDVFIEITQTATKGTVARIVDIEIETYGERYPNSTHHPDPTELIGYDATFIYEVDEPKKKGRINSSYAKFLAGKHTTKYVRNVNKHDKKEVKNPVNKFKQEMNKGDIIVGVSHGKHGRLVFGRITRWTETSVWVTMDDETVKKPKETRMNIAETFIMPSDDHVAMLTWAIMKGWDGR